MNAFMIQTSYVFELWADCNANDSAVCAISLC